MLNITVMRLSQKHILLYGGIFILFYFFLIYLMLKLPSYREVTSFMRSMLVTNVSYRVYGYGTVMVDVTSLGRRNTKRKMGFSQVNEFRIIENKGLSRKCFKLTSNGNLTLRSKPDTNFNQRQTTDSDESGTTSQMKWNGAGLCNSYITIDSPPGRSGNQMFLIAALLGTAFSHDMIPVIPTAFPLSEWFELPNVLKIGLENAETFTAKKSGKYLPDVDKLNSAKNWTMRGYFQSWKYFRNATDIVKSVFKMKEKYLENPRSFIRNTSKVGQMNVCVHVRRGDLDDHVVLRKGYAIADLDFIRNAMNFYRNKFKAVRFIVLSDGMIWCMENIRGRDVIFSPFDWPAEDMALMALCDHVIVTSGTFGWWGAWLSGGITVYFKGYPRQGSWLSSQIDTADYYPPDWIAL